MKKTFIFLLLFVFAVSAALAAPAAKDISPVRTYRSWAELFKGSSPTATVPKQYVSKDNCVFRYRWHEPSVKTPGRKYPLVVLLHGAGERGTNNVSQLVWGAQPIFNYMKKRGEEFFFVAGQVPNGRLWADIDWTTMDHRMRKKPSVTMAQLIELLDKLRNTEKAIDLDRIYVTGVSMGGYGTWDLISRKTEWFAAAMPVCGGGDVKQAVKLRDLPIFIHHGDVDGAVPVWRGRSMIAALREAGSCVARYTEYPGCGHASWHPAYGDEANLEWMFSKKRPVTDAWKNVNLTPEGLPATSSYFDVAFEFSCDKGASWSRGLVRKVPGFALQLVDDRVVDAPAYEFKCAKGVWILSSPAGSSVTFRNVRTRPLPADFK